MKREEDKIQRAVCRNLNQRGVRGVVWFHVPNGGKRGKVSASILKGLGVKAGVADLILLHRGNAYALELKAEKGKPSVSQMEFMSDFNSAGGNACIVHGLDRALKVLETWGLLRGTAQ